MAFLVLVLASVLKVSGVAVFCKTYSDPTTCAADAMCVWIKSVNQTCDVPPVAADCTPASACNTSICDYTPPAVAKCEVDSTVTCDSLKSSVCNESAGCTWTEDLNICVGDTSIWVNKVECKLFPSITSGQKPYGTCRAGGGSLFTFCVEKTVPECVEKVAGSGKNCQLDAEKKDCTGEDAADCNYVAATCGAVGQCSDSNGSGTGCAAHLSAMGCEAGSCSGTLAPGTTCTEITPAAQGDCTAVAGCKFIGAVAETCTPKSVSCTHKCVVKSNGGENNAVSSFDKDAAFTIKTPLLIITLLVLVFVQ